MPNEEHLNILRKGRAQWDLWRADNIEAIPNLNGADLSGANVGNTNFPDTDLTHVRGLDSVTHERRSSIGVDCMARTLRSSGGKFLPEHLQFFGDAGVPLTLLDYLPTILQADPLQFYSCFIGHSSNDERFADQLKNDLNEWGIKTWKRNLDALPARDRRDHIDRTITTYDKMILVCSVNSLTSRLVDWEIEKALKKEDQLSAAKVARAKEAYAAGEEPPFVDTNVLVPIRMDDFVFEWDSPFAAQVKRLYIPDFTEGAEGDEKHQRELRKLREALNSSAWPPQPPEAPSTHGTT